MKYLAGETANEVMPKYTTFEDFASSISPEKFVTVIDWYEVVDDYEDYPYDYITKYFDRRLLFDARVPSSQDEKKAIFKLLSTQSFYEQIRFFRDSVYAPGVEEGPVYEKRNLDILDEVSFFWKNNFISYIEYLYNNYWIYLILVALIPFLFRYLSRLTVSVKILISDAFRKRKDAAAEAMRLEEAKAQRLLDKQRRKRLEEKQRKRRAEELERQAYERDFNDDMETIDILVRKKAYEEAKSTIEIMREKYPEKTREIAERSKRMMDTIRHERQKTRAKEDPDGKYKF